MTPGMNKEQWIDSVINSTDGMAKASPASSFYEGVINKLDNHRAVKTIAFPIKQWAAAAILLLALNIGSILYYTEHSKRSNAGENGNPLAAAMSSSSTYNY